MKKSQNNNEGITLIALVITIIVLVILVGVSVSVAINTGLIANSKKAVADYDNAQADEEAQIQNVTDLVEQYNGTAARTIAELYDGINDPEAENYNENAMHIGDYVNYTAGTWSETKEVPAEASSYTFGGYTAGQSRDTNASGIEIAGEIQYQGWKIWDISDDEKTITLISAGCPEGYYHPGETNSAYKSEKILTGATTETLDETIEARNWNADYVNKAQYGSSAKAFTKSELDAWYNTYIDSRVTDTAETSHFPSFGESKLISTVANGYGYWLASVYDETNLWFLESEGGWADCDEDRCRGIRILVTLTSDVKFSQTPQKITDKIDDYEWTYNKWIIK